MTTDRNIDTREAKVIAGYEPLYLSRTLQLSQNPKDNVMTFVYAKKAPDQAPYTVKYYFETEDGKYQPDEDKTLNFSGKVGSEVTVGGDQLPETINGYKLNREKSKLTGTITVESTLELQVYYDKIKVTPNPDPDTPTEPSTPGGSEPSTPSTPTDSTTPTLPGNPSDPYKPDESTVPTEPSQPTTPTEPSEPTQPGEPTESTEPTVPTEPSEPTLPTESTSPTDTTEPSQPTMPSDASSPSTPTEPSTPTTSRQELIAQTGEHAGQLYLAGALFLLAGVVLVVLRKREQNKH